MRLIDTEAYKNRLEKAKIRLIGCGHELFDFAIETLENAPTIDPVHAAGGCYCRECEFYQDNNGGYPHPECRWNPDETPDADDYCSYGKRRENHG